MVDVSLPDVRECERMPRIPGETAVDDDRLEQVTAEGQIGKRRPDAGTQQCIHQSTMTCVTGEDEPGKRESEDRTWKTIILGFKIFFRKCYFAILWLKYAYSVPMQHVKPTE